MTGNITHKVSPIVQAYNFYKFITKLRKRRETTNLMKKSNSRQRQTERTEQQIRYGKGKNKCSCSMTTHLRALQQGHYCYQIAWKKTLNLKTIDHMTYVQWTLTEHSNHNEHTSAYCSEKGCWMWENNVCHCLCCTLYFELDEFLKLIKRFFSYIRFNSNSLCICNLY